MVKVILGLAVLLMRGVFVYTPTSYRVRNSMFLFDDSHAKVMQSKTACVRKNNPLYTFS